MKEEQNISNELKYIVKTIKKRFYIIIPLTILAFLASLYFYKTNIQKPSYYVMTSLIIGNTIDSSGTKYQVDDINQYKGLMSTYCSIAKTTIVSEKTIEKLKLNVSPSVIENSLTVQPQQDTQFMDLSLIWSDPKQAVDILNTLSESFIEEAKSVYPTCNIKVMQKVGSPQVILPSDKKVYLIIGPLVGIVISLLIIFAIDFMDDTLKTEEEVEEYLGLSVIGLVPKERKKTQIINQKTIKELQPSFLEAYRALRNNIYFSSIYKEVKSIVVTSSKPGDGKTTTAAMLAFAMAQAGKKTILVDCDLRQSKVHKTFNISNMLGLTNILLGESRWNEAVYKGNIENLYILSAGITPPDPSEILASTKMQTFIEVLKRDFDYIILDTPPIGLITDAQVLSKVADGYLLVVSAGESVGKETLKAKKIIEHLQGRILGIVLNKVTDSYNYRYYKNYYNNKVHAVKSVRKVKKDELFAVVTKS